MKIEKEIVDFTFSVDLADWQMRLHLMAFISNITDPASLLGVN